MSDHVKLISDRIAKAEAKVARYKKSLETAELELSELQIALRVLSGLSGEVESNAGGTGTTLGRQRDIVRLMGVGRENAQPPAEIYAAYLKASDEKISIDTFRTTIWRMKGKSFVVDVTPYTVFNDEGVYWIEQNGISLGDIDTSSLPDDDYENEPETPGRSGSETGGWGAPTPSSPWVTSQSRPPWEQD
ncbi:hypothetical protein [Sphingopyxis sp. LC363]|uniref:hypothetical protein n=1 Tax=Sphingopyxis sp. LC363 TaxID=1120705 RepID=UPI00126A1BD6|nr:hypothetical protein [Sphingopyxis sp. LC363]